MDVEIQGLCATIIDFLVHALQYQKKWSVVKIMGGIVTDFAKRFQSFVVKIKRHASSEVLVEFHIFDIVDQDLLKEPSHQLCA